MKYSLRNKQEVHECTLVKIQYFSIKEYDVLLLSSLSSACFPTITLGYFLQQSSVSSQFESRVGLNSFVSDSLINRPGSPLVRRLLSLWYDRKHPPAHSMSDGVIKTQTSIRPCRRHNYHTTKSEDISAVRNENLIPQINKDGTKRF